MKVNFNKIKELRVKINKLIQEQPQLKKLQDEIDSRLSKCNNPHNRATVIQEMMLNVWGGIVDVWENSELPSKLQLSEIQNNCENCDENVKEELQEVRHTETRRNYFVCEKCCESDFYRIVL